MIKQASNIFLLACLFGLMGCKKLVFEPQPNGTNQEVFDEFWGILSENYVFSDLKNVNWETIYNNYAPGISENTTEKQLFKILGDVMSQLKDGHTNIYADFSTWRYNYYKDFPANNNRSFVETHYLDPYFKIGPFLITVLADNVGYLNYRSFRTGFTAEELASTVEFLNNHTIGLILDLRGNQGGSLENVFKLLSAFTTENIKVGEMYLPNENNELEKTEDLYVRPDEKTGLYTHQVVVLSNRKCYSAASVGIGFMRQLDHFTIVGDTTGGGSGIAIGTDLSNGWQFRYSSGKITFPDNVDFELGVAPDEYVTTGAEEEELGIDAIIERAVEIIK